MKRIFKLSDNNEYLAVCETNYNNNKYVFLSDINNLGNIKICIQFNGELTECTNDEFNKMVKIFNNLINNELNNGDANE